MNKENLKEYDKLEIGKPEYISIDKVKTVSIPLDRNKKYSQVSVKNTSNENMYDIVINLKDNNKNKIGGDMYFIEVLEPGEESIVTTMHNKSNEELGIYSYNYELEDETSIYIQDEIVKIDNLNNENIMYKETDKLNKDIDVIKILDTKIIDKEKHRTNMEVKIKNISDKELEWVSLYFKEFYKNDFIGINDNSLLNSDKPLKPGEEATLNVRYNNDATLEFTGYRYKLIDENKEIYNHYSVYPKLDVYRYYEYNENNILSTDGFINKSSSIVIILIVFLIMIMVSQIRYRISKNNKHKRK